MNAHYQEHIEHVAGEASEFQNAFTEAGDVRRRLAYEHGAKISEGLAAGLFVVVQEVTYHCRSTDALVGTYESFVSAHQDRQAAEDHAARLRYYPDPEECPCYVLPRLPRPAPAPAPEPEPEPEPEVDDCPF